jgi:hypothetical protein
LCTDVSIVSVPFVMARASLELLEKLMEEQRPPNEGEYKILVDELMVHHHREQSDGPIEHDIVWPSFIIFEESDGVQTRIDKMARKLSESEETLTQLEENNLEVSRMISEAIHRAERDTQRRRDTPPDRRHANSGRSRSPETR